MILGRRVGAISYISKLTCKINLRKNNCNTDMEELSLWTHPLTPHSPSGREALYGSCYIDLQCSNRIWCCLGPLSASGRGYMPPTRSLPCRNSPNNLHSAHIQQLELRSFLHIVYSTICKL